MRVKLQFGGSPKSQQRWERCFWKTYSRIHNVTIKPKMVEVIRLSYTILHNFEIEGYPQTKQEVFRRILTTFKARPAFCSSQDNAAFLPLAMIVEINQNKKIGCYIQLEDYKLEQEMQEIDIKIGIEVKTLLRIPYDTNILSALRKIIKLPATITISEKLLRTIVSVFIFMLFTTLYDFSKAVSNVNRLFVYSNFVTLENSIATLEVMNNGTN